MSRSWSNAFSNFFYCVPYGNTEKQVNKIGWIEFRWGKFLDQYRCSFADQTNSEIRVHSSRQQRPCQVPWSTCPTAVPRSGVAYWRVARSVGGRYVLWMVFAGGTRRVVGGGVRTTRGRSFWEGTFGGCACAGRVPIRSQLSSLFLRESWKPSIKNEGNQSSNKTSRTRNE